MALLSALAGGAVGAGIVSYMSRKDYMNYLKKLQQAMVGIQASLIHRGEITLADVVPATEEYRQQVRDTYFAYYHEACPDNTVQSEN
jgi:hypothetical protein